MPLEKASILIGAAVSPQLILLHLSSSCQMVHGIDVKSGRMMDYGVHMKWQVQI